MTMSAVELKGTSFTISVVHLVDSDLSNLTNALSAKVAQAPAFFQNAPVVVSVSQLQATIDYRGLEQAVLTSGFHLVGITGYNSAEEKQAIQSAGLAVISAGKQLSEQEKPEQDSQQPQTEQPLATVNPPKVVRGQVRSGQQIYAKGSNLVIIGSVSNGAEVIADGDIHVYGTLRGRAIAGASGQTACGIYCQSLQAELISIAGHYQMSDSLQSHWEQARSIQLIDQQLKISDLN